MIFRLYTVYNKHEMIKISNKPEKNRKCYRECPNNFAVDCCTNFTLLSIAILLVSSILALMSTYFASNVWML